MPGSKPETAIFDGVYSIPRTRGNLPSNAGANIIGHHPTTNAFTPNIRAGYRPGRDNV